MTTIYLETNSLNPCYNLAFEQYVLEHRLVGDYLLLWQNANTVVVGRHQNTEEEINRPFIEEHNITVVRRGTGGGAVYHDLGNLNYSFITDASTSDRLGLLQFTKPVVEALCKLGLQAEASGRNDILVDGKKVSGTAQRLHKNRILHHGTLLFESNPAMIAGALNADPQKFQSKSSKSVRSRIGNIRPALSKDMNMEAFWKYLKSELSNDGFTQGKLTKDELLQIEAVKVSRYDTWTWNYGHSPAYDLHTHKRWSNGSLEVFLCVKNGLITHVDFRGDFLGRSSLDKLCDAMVGCPLHREEVESRIKDFPLQDLFGGISLSEILDTIFS